MAHIEVRDYLRETNLIQSRLVFAAIFVVLLCLILLYRLYLLQVGDYDRYATLSQDNRIRLIPVPPARGQIYDRKGKILAENLPVYALEVIPDQVKDMEKTIERLAEFVDLSETELRRFREALQQRPSFEQRILKVGLDDAEVARFSVNQHNFSGVHLRAKLQRHYPYGEELVHVVGYVGRISEADLKKIDHTEYRGTNYIGKLGIEASYENELFGKVGFEQAETNAHGRIVRTLSRTAPISGVNLHLSIDVDLQLAARKLLTGYEGSVVALEPNTGEVLAFVSNPAYDPNPFVNGIDQKSYQNIRTDPRRPLLNRSLNGRYAPGSTIKGIFGLAGLSNQRSPNRPLRCPGWFSLKGSSHRYRCWNRAGHGHVNMHSAIVQSCDVYFYQLAHSLGIDTLHEFMTEFGLGVATGIDLQYEPSGLMPSRDWKRNARGQPWYPGETVITGIGQGYMLVTPLQLATVTATLANRGKRIRPRIVAATGSKTRDQAEPKQTEILGEVLTDKPGFYKAIIKAMTDVVHGPRGTARRSGLNAEYTFAGKTGTAQVIGIAQGAKYEEDKLAKKFRDHSLFIAFAPVDDPEIAVAVIIENGGSGSRTAAPIARKVMDHYLLGPAESNTEVANAG